MSALPQDQLRYRECRRFVPHASAVSCVKFSGDLDGRALATAGTDGSVRIFSTRGWESSLLKGPHSAGVSEVTWSPDSKYLLSASDDCTTVIWSVEKARPVRTLEGHKNAVMCGKYSPAGNLIATGSFDETIFFWDVRAGNPIRNIKAHSAPVTGLDFSATDQQLVSCSYDGLCRIWDLRQGRCVNTLFEEHNPPVGNVLFAPNGRYILTNNLDNTVRLWSFQNDQRRRVCVYNGHQNNRLPLFPTFSVTDDARRVVCGSEDGAVWLWDLKTSAPLQVIRAHRGPVMAVASHPSHSRDLIASCSAGADRTLSIWSETEDPDPELAQEPKAAKAAAAAAVSSSSSSPQRSKPRTKRGKEEASEDDVSDPDSDSSSTGAPSALKRRKRS